MPNAKNIDKIIESGKHIAIHPNKIFMVVPNAIIQAPKNDKFMPLTSFSRKHHFTKLKYHFIFCSSCFL